MKKTINLLYAVVPAMIMMLSIGSGCSKSDSGASGGGVSQGGSMARFTISGDYLYTVDHSKLKIVSISDPETPIEVNSESVGWDIETIFTMDDLLFIGSRDAMYIYDISNPEFPKRKSIKNHFRSCDPVVAYGNLAFVTLNNAPGTGCGGRGNFLQVYDITDLEDPVMTYQVGLTSPYGLAVDGEEKLVFVCDNGVKAFDFTNPRKLVGKYTAAGLPEVGNIDAFDCIAMNGTLLVIGADGLYQLGYDSEKFTFISKIALK